MAKKIFSAFFIFPNNLKRGGHIQKKQAYRRFSARNGRQNGDFFLFLEFINFTPHLLQCQPRNE